MKINFKLEWADFEELECVLSKNENKISFEGTTENGNEVSFWIPVMEFDMR